MPKFIDQPLVTSRIRSARSSERPDSECRDSKTAPLSVEQFGFAAIPPRLSRAALAKRATDRCRGEAEGGEEEDDGQHDAPGLPGEVGEYQVANSGQCVEKRL